jgi:hypothetical protein
MKSALLSLVVVVALVASAGSAHAQRMRGGFSHPMMMHTNPMMMNTNPFINPRFNIGSGARPNFSNTRLINPRFNIAPGAMPNFSNTVVVNPRFRNVSPFHNQFVLPVTPNQALANHTILANNALANRAIFANNAIANRTIFLNRALTGGFFPSTFAPNIFSGALSPTANALRLSSAMAPFSVLSGVPIIPASAFLSPFGLSAGLAPFTQPSPFFPSFWAGAPVTWATPFTGANLSPSFWPWGGLDFSSTSSWLGF